MSNIPINPRSLIVHGSCLSGNVFVNPGKYYIYSSDSSFSTGALVHVTPLLVTSGGRGHWCYSSSVKCQVLSLRVYRVSLLLRVSPHGGNPRQTWILDSTPWIPDYSRYRILVFISGSCIQASSHYWYSGFFELYSRLQNPGFRIPWARISRIPDSTGKNVPDSRIRIPLHLGDEVSDPFCNSC